MLNFFSSYFLHHNLQFRVLVGQSLPLQKRTALPADDAIGHAAPVPLNESTQN
jgi:hypothetical protein